VMTSILHKGIDVARNLFRGQGWKIGVKNLVSKVFF